MKGYLYLENGDIFEGKLYGYIPNSLDIVGELVFNTSMTGYQEILTDPSYYGQIVVLTYPLIGNYGINYNVNQSSSIKVTALVVSEFNNNNFHNNSEENLEKFLIKNKITCISDVDTRALTKIIRKDSSIRAKIVKELKNTSSIITDIKSFENKGVVYKITTSKNYTLNPKKSNGKKVAVMDFGIKKNILNSLLSRGFKLKVFKASTSFEEIKNYNPDGVFLSNGPGDPEELIDIIEVVKKLIDNYPVFGICLGHQLIALASGFKTEKMKFGHRGGNHPVKDLILNKIYITPQNHGYAVKKDSIDENKAIITHINLNDGSIEGLRLKNKLTFSVQYHPESSPGPMESEYLFDLFSDLIFKGGFTDGY